MLTVVTLRYSLKDMIAGKPAKLAIANTHSSYSYLSENVKPRGLTLWLCKASTFRNIARLAIPWACNNASKYICFSHLIVSVT